MKKFIWISLVIFLTIGCGSRKKSVTKKTSETETENISSGNYSTHIQSGTSSESNISQFLQNNDLKIVSNGLPYELQYGNLILKGSANVEFSQKKEKTIYKNRYTDFFIYHHKNIYQTITNYRTETTYKALNAERFGLSFGNAIWIIITSMVGGAALWTWLKSYLPKWRINLFNKK